MGILFFSGAAAWASSVTEAGQPLEHLNRLGRICGCGWGDGYQACRSSGVRPFADLPPLSYASRYGIEGQPCDGCGPTPVDSGMTFYDRFDASASSAVSGGAAIGSVPTAEESVLQPPAASQQNLQPSQDDVEPLRDRVEMPRAIAPGANHDDAAEPTLPVPPERPIESGTPEDLRETSPSDLRRLQTPDALDDAMSSPRRLPAPIGAARMPQPQTTQRLPATDDGSHASARVAADWLVIRQPK